MHAIRAMRRLATWTILAAAHAAAQAHGRTPTGWEMSGIPALNFDADEGFGYGAIVHWYNYGARGAEPYLYTIQTTVFLTTRGRRDVNLFFDAPRLAAGWRVGAYLAREQQLATPYYGIGNEAVFDRAATQEPNPYYYRYGRTGVRFTLQLQRPITRSARVLLGVGFRTSSIQTVPYDSGTTLLAQQVGAGGVPPGRVPFARLGLVWDTRDREIGPRHGTWAEFLVQGTDRVLGGTERFVKATATVRYYASPWPRVTFAQRLIIQNVSGDARFFELFPIQGSFKDDEGLGGNATVRGLPKNRFTGKGLFLSNSEVRFRAAEFRLLRRESSLVVNGFFDAGRVWDDRVHPDELLRGLHTGVGAGVRLGFGPSFVIATDLGHSSERAVALYIGLGYLF